MADEFNLNKEIHKSITQKRMRTWRWTTAVSNVPKKVIKSFAHVQSPNLGDLVLAQVSAIGMHEVVEQANGSRLSIFPGTVVVGAFGHRYATGEFEGKIPEELKEGDEIDLLNVGGTLGTATSVCSGKRSPTKFKVLSFFKDQEGRIANTQNYPKKILPADHPEQPKHDINLIIVTGTSMNSGKSHTAKAIIYSLTSAGKSVVAGKVTGTSAKKDSLLMKSAGAIEICDFVDFGYPSTYFLSEEKLKKLFWDIFGYLRSKLEHGGYIVLEIADGIFQRETEMLLADEDIQNLTKHYMFSCSESLSAVAGVQLLKEKYNIKVSAISGPSTNSPLSLKEVKRFIKDVPTFNNMVIDAPTIASIFVSDAGASSDQIKVKPEEVPVLPEVIVKD